MKPGGLTVTTPTTDIDEASPRIGGKTELVEYLEAGSKPKADWRIGTEHEKFGFLWDGLKPLPYEGKASVKAMLEGLRDRFGWEEPGGQFELSGAPLESIHDTCTEVGQHLSEVRELAEPLGIGFLGLGASPIWSRRYAGDAQGPLQDHDGLHAEGRHVSAGHDVPHLHRAGEPRFLLGSRHGEEAARHRSRCSRSARRCSPTRPSPKASPTASCPSARRSGPTRTPTRRHAALRLRGRLRLRALCRLRARRADVFRAPRRAVPRRTGLSFRDFMDGKLSILPGERPAMDDFADHLSTIFPEVRLKTLPRNARLRRRSLGPALRFLGLLDRYPSAAGDDESGFLSGLDEIAASGLTPAERLLQRYYGPWNRDLSKVFAEEAY
jgi:glutamate--cysteine ligase